jgi:hypothetical protein
MAKDGKRMVDLEGETVVFLRVRPGNVERATKVREPENR